jgi:uncharacterized membrane protein YphA (DoxX/SURF4 family)
LSPIAIRACRFWRGSFVAVVETHFDMETTMRRTNVILWTIQGLLALSFLFAGSMKLLTPAATLAQMAAPLPVALLRFIGLCEVVGALGLILPGLLRIRSYLTPIAAAGLVIIMSGAVSANVTLGHANQATAPAVLGVLALLVVVLRIAGACVGRRADHVV